MEGFKPNPKDHTVSANPLMVCNLFNQETFMWNLELLLDMFKLEIVEAIKKIIISIALRMIS